MKPTETFVQFWQNNDYKSGENEYGGAQQKCDGLSGIDSLKTGPNSWLIAFNGKNFTGDQLRVGGAQAAGKSDLNHVDRGGSRHDWKNQIVSFVLFNYQPSFWNGGNFDKNTPLIQHMGSMFFMETNYCGSNINFVAGSSAEKLQDQNYSTYPQNGTSDLFSPKSNVGSLRTGANTWLVIYNGNSFTGDQLKINPNTDYPDLDTVKRGSNGDWKNQITSFQSFNQYPKGWDLRYDKNTFLSSFDGYEPHSDYFSYNTQDANYHVYYPWLSYPNAEQLEVSTRVDYTAGSNDKVYLAILFNADGHIDSITYSYEQGGAIKIPSKLVKAVDAGVEVAGAVGALETAGISEEAAQSFVETFDEAVKIFDDVSDVIYKLVESNDGSFYLAALVSHVIARIALSVSPK